MMKHSLQKKCAKGDGGLWSFKQAFYLDWIADWKGKEDWKRRTEAFRVSGMEDSLPEPGAL